LIIVITNTLNKTKPVMRKTLFLLGLIHGYLVNGQLETRVSGPDTLCIGEIAIYSVEVLTPPNRYLFRDTAAARSCRI
jgi:hypothetical protein